MKKSFLLLFFAIFLFFSRVVIAEQNWKSALDNLTNVSDSLRFQVKKFTKEVQRHPTRENLENFEVIGNWMELNEESVVSEEVSKIGIQLSRQEGFEQLEFDFLVLYASNLSNRGNFKKADSVFSILQNLAKKLELDDDPSFGIAKANYFSAIGEKMEAVKIFERVGRLYKNSNQENYGVVLINIGVIYKDLGLYRQSISNFLNALEVFESLGNKKRQALACQHLANCYMRNDQLDSALFHLNKGYKLAVFRSSNVEVARYYSALGNIYRRKKLFKQAHTYIDSSIFLAAAHGFPIGVLINQINKSEVFYDQGDFQAALSLLQQVENQVVGENIPEIKLEFFRLMGMVLESLGRYKESVLFKNQYINYKSQLDKLQNSNLILEIGNSLGKEISRSEVERLSLEIEREKNRNWWISMILVSSIVISLLSVRAWRIQKRKNELEIKLEMEEKELLHAKEELENKERIIENMELLAEVGFLEKSLDVIQSMKRGRNKEEIAVIDEVLEVLSKGDSQKIWKDFELSYSEVHEEFFEKLKSIGPELTPNEIKICSLIRLNLSTKEIAGITHRTPGRIDNIRSVIRKKINLDQEINLTNFLRSL